MTPATLLAELQALLAEFPPAVGTEAAWIGRLNAAGTHRRSMAAVIAAADQRYGDVLDRLLDAGILDTAPGKPSVRVLRDEDEP